MLHIEKRPDHYGAVHGNKSALATLSSFDENDLPHCLLFTGPSGCGKTTMSRIFARRLGATKKNRCLKEINCADFRGIDMVRDIRKVMHLKPMGGKVVVYLIDEAHQLSKDAQNALLKMLEEPPRHIYFILATTEPNKLIATVRNRCTVVGVKSLTDAEMKTFLKSFKDDHGVSKVVTDAIVEAAGGSPRKGLVLLETASGLTDDDALEAVRVADGSTEGIELARALFAKKNWKQISGMLKGLSGDPEGVRNLILHYCSSVLLGGGPMQKRSAAIIEEFSETFMYSKKAGLVLACWRIYNE